MSPRPSARASASKGSECFTDPDVDIPEGPDADVDGPGGTDAGGTDAGGGGTDTGSGDTGGDWSPEDDPLHSIRDCWENGNCDDVFDDGPGDTGPRDTGDTGDTGDSGGGFGDTEPVVSGTAL